MTRWTWIASLLAVVFFALALSSDVYALTSPWHLSWHVWLRKAYSVIAFGIVGFAARRALDDHRLPRNVGWNVLLLAGYSALIELVQFLGGSKEGLGWNAVDVACGALGGLLGNGVARAFDRTGAVLSSRPTRERPPH